MPIAIAQPNMQKKDPLDTVLKGLQIAGSIYGIQEARAKLGDRDQQIAERERKTRGELTPGELMDRQKEGFQVVDPGAEGASRAKITDGREVGLSPPRPKSEMRIPARETYRDPTSGKNRIGIVGDDGRLVVNTNDPLASSQPKDNTHPDGWIDPKLQAARERAQRQYNEASRPYDEAINAADEVGRLAELSKTNPTAAGALGSRVARAAGEKGVLSDMDIKRYGGSQAVAAKLERLVQTAAEGTMTSDDVGFAQQLADTMKKNAELAKIDIGKKHTSQFTRNYRGNEKENFGIITGFDLPNGGDAGSIAGSNTPPPQTLTREEILAEIARRNKGRMTAGGSKPVNIDFRTPEAQAGVLKTLRGRGSELGAK